MFVVEKKKEEVMGFLYSVMERIREANHIDVSRPKEIFNVSPDGKDCVAGYMCEVPLIPWAVEDLCRFTANLPKSEGVDKKIMRPAVIAYARAFRDFCKERGFDAPMVPMRTLETFCDPPQWEDTKDMWNRIDDMLAAIPHKDSSEFSNGYLADENWPGEMCVVTVGLVETADGISLRMGVAPETAMDDPVKVISKKLPEEAIEDPVGAAYAALTDIHTPWYGKTFEHLSWERRVTDAGADLLRGPCA